MGAAVFSFTNTMAHYAGMAGSGYVAWWVVTRVHPTIIDDTFDKLRRLDKEIRAEATNERVEVAQRLIRNGTDPETIGVSVTGVNIEHSKALRELRRAKHNHVTYNPSLWIHDAPNINMSM